jgi:hypothetical protein
MGISWLSGSGLGAELHCEHNKESCPNAARMLTVGDKNYNQQVMEYEKVRKEMDRESRKESWRSK